MKRIQCKNVEACRNLTASLLKQGYLPTGRVEYSPLVGEEPDCKPVAARVLTHWQGGVLTSCRGRNLTASLLQQGYSPTGRVEFLNWMLGNSGSAEWKLQNSSI